MKELLALLKEEAAAMYREQETKCFTRTIEDFDRAMQMDFCRFTTMLLNRVEKKLDAVLAAGEQPTNKPDKPR